MACLRLLGPENHSDDLFRTVPVEAAVPAMPRVVTILCTRAECADLLLIVEQYVSHLCAADAAARCIRLPIAVVGYQTGADSPPDSSTFSRSSSSTRSASCAFVRSIVAAL